MNISDIDKNFIISRDVFRPDMVLHDCLDIGFSLHGVFFQRGKFRRIPEEAAAGINAGVKELHSNTAGGRLRFRTDSQYVAVFAKMPDICTFSHMPLTGTSGFDVYVDNMFHGLIIPPTDCKGEYDGIVELDGRMHDILIDFPLYNDVEAVTVGLSENATVQSANEYRIKEPTVFYGSSITQGACASRPGLSYEAILSRELDFDYINLGFSGAAYGEIQMAEYIAEMEMSCFVLDYDHNAPDIAHLKATHEPFYRLIREQQPYLPIIIASAPNARIAEPEWETRRALIRDNYDRFVDEGDENLWYVDGNALWGSDGWDNCTVDTRHPNDLGLWRMSRALVPVLKTILYS